MPWIRRPRKARVVVDECHCFRRSVLAELAHETASRAPGADDDDPAPRPLVADARELGQKPQDEPGGRHESGADHRVDHEDTDGEVAERARRAITRKASTSETPTATAMAKTSRAVA